MLSAWHSDSKLSKVSNKITERTGNISLNIHHDIAARFVLICRV